MHVDAVIILLLLALLGVCLLGFAASLLRLNRIDQTVIMLRQQLGVRRHTRGDLT